jgi:chromosomal replication initiator protein
MRKMLKPEQIVHIVADYYGTDLENMLANNRLKDNVGPRHVAMYMIRYNTRCALRRIGEIMQGNRKTPYDHTTVIHAIRKVFAYLETDDAFEAQIDAIQANIVEMMKGSKEKPAMIIKPEVKKTEPAKVVRMETLAESEKVLNSYL